MQPILALVPIRATTEEAEVFEQSTGEQMTSESLSKYVQRLWSAEMTRLRRKAEEDRT